MNAGSFRTYFKVFQHVSKHFKIFENGPKHFGMFRHISKHSTKLAQYIAKSFKILQNIFEYSKTLRNVTTYFKTFDEGGVRNEGGMKTCKGEVEGGKQNRRSRPGSTPFGSGGRFGHCKISPVISQHFGASKNLSIVS